MSIDYQQTRFEEPGLTARDFPNLYEPVFREFEVGGENIFKPTVPIGDGSLFILRLTPNLYAEAERVAQVWASVANRKEREVTNSAPVQANSGRLKSALDEMDFGRSGYGVLAMLYPGLFQESEDGFNQASSSSLSDDDVWEHSSEHKSDGDAHDAIQPAPMFAEPDDLTLEQDFAASLVEPLPYDDAIRASMENVKPNTAHEIEAEQFSDCQKVALWIKAYLHSEEFLASSPDAKEVCIGTDESGQCHGIIVIEHDQNPNDSTVRFLVTNPINIRSSVNDLEVGKKHKVGTLLMDYAEWSAAQKTKGFVTLNALESSETFYPKLGYQNDGVSSFYRKNLYRERAVAQLQLAM